MKPLTSREIVNLSKQEKEPRKQLSLLAVAHFLDGKNRTEIANMLKVSRRSVNDWIARYLNLGLAGLDTKKQKGREPYLSGQQRHQLSNYITECSQSSEGGRLTGTVIIDYIQSQFGVNYHPNAIYKLLRTLGFSWITSRSRHPKQSQEAQDAFKKTENGSDQKSTWSPTA